MAFAIVWSAGGYFSARGSDAAGLFAAGAILFGGIALAVIWLGVLVVYVINSESEWLRRADNRRAVSPGRACCENALGKPNESRIQTPHEAKNREEGEGGTQGPLLNLAARRVFPPRLSLHRSLTDLLAVEVISGSRGPKV